MEPPQNKTPVSLLHEICTRNNITPQYNLLQVEGPVHEPVFKYRLTVEYESKRIEEIGCGKSKKEAKHNTAVAILKAMNISTKELFGECYGEVDPVEMEDTRAGGSDSGDPSGNPVGLLQELCMKMKLPPPTYCLHSEDGLPHERVFSLACKVGEHYVEIGRGKSKKLAKRHAAYLMAQRLRNIPSESSNVHGFDDDDDRIVEGLRALSIARETTVKQFQNATCGDFDWVSRMHEKYVAMFLEKLPELKNPDLVVTDPVEFLASLQISGRAKPMYIDFDELAGNGMVQCLLQIPFDPPMVSIGEGETRDLAQKSAAADAIKVIREFLPTPEVCDD